MVFVGRLLWLAAAPVRAEGIEVREVAAPEAPADGLVLEMRACGVCGSDLRRWREGPPSGTAHLVQGHELAGVVVEVGAAVAARPLRA